MEQLIEMIKTLLEDARAYCEEQQETGDLEDRQTALEYVRDLESLLIHVGAIVCPFDYQDDGDDTGDNDDCQDID